MALEYVHKKGRPNTKDRTSMQEKIIEYYEKNISAATASRETGFNIKTIYKYYDELSKQILELQTANFIERNNIATAQLISSNERLALKLQQLLDNTLDEMSRLIQENKPIPKHLINDITRITNLIAEMNEKNYNLSISIENRNKNILENNESENIVKKIVRHLTINRDSTSHMSYTKREIIQEIIDLIKCDVSYAESVFFKMIDFGLDVCGRDDLDSEFSKKYWLLPFATTRNYVSNEELHKMMERSTKDSLEE